MLTQDQKLQFREDGFLLFEELISGDRLARYVEVFDELVERGRSLLEPEPHFSLELETDGSPELESIELLIEGRNNRPIMVAE